MKTIVNAKENIVNAWGHPKPKDAVYRPLKYLLRVEHEDGTLLHNVVTGQLVLLSKEETEAFDRLPGSYSPALDELIADHFAVTEGFDEHKSVLQIKTLLRKISEAKSKHITGYTILPTSNCNARCFYCYEANAKHVNMTEETAHQAVTFIRQNCGGEKVSLSWFGGEPTIAADRINQICRELEEAGIDYHSTMISNGYLLNAEMADKAKNLWKLKSVQITLDGTEETYNRVKNYRAAQGSPFKTVMANIDSLLEREIKVVIRMNLDRHNVDDLRTLIEELIERYSGKDNFSAYVHPLFDDCGFVPVEHSKDDHDWLIARRDELNGRLSEGFPREKHKSALPSTKYQYCMADSNVSVIINPDGSLSKCEHTLMDDTFGTVWDGLTDMAGIAAWRETEEYPECKECPLFPNCHLLKKCFNTKPCRGAEQESRLKEAVKAVSCGYHPS